MADLARTALVVGGGSGIGAGCAATLAEHDWDVVVADLKPPDAPGSIALDVRDADGVSAAVDALAAERGGLGAVVYAAGTARVTPVLEISPREWDLILGVNLTGAFNTIRACAPHMPRGAAFVVISSVDSSSPVPGLAHYSAAKAGVEALVRSVALELGAQGLRANAVLPGVVRTPLMAPMLARPEVEAEFLKQTPLGAIAEGPEISDVVAFLVSHQARWITGVSLPVDGGMSLREHPHLLQDAH